MSIQTKSMINKTISVALLLFSTHTLAGHSAIATDDSGDVFWSHKETRQQSESAALQECAQGATKKNCKIITHKAFAFAKGSSYESFYTSEKGLDDAKRVALSQCRANSSDCKIIQLSKEPGFLSVASPSNTASRHGFYYAYGEMDLRDAKLHALRACEEATSEQCKTVLVAAIQGENLIFSKAANTDSKNQITETSCRPQSTSITCTSQCVNGDCVITYENGCKKRIRVSPTFDPTTNSWRHPAPQC